MSLLRRRRRADPARIAELEREARQARAEAEHLSTCECGCRSGSAGLVNSVTYADRVVCRCCPSKELEER